MLTVHQYSSAYSVQCMYIFMMGTLEAQIMVLLANRGDHHSITNWTGASRDAHTAPLVPTNLPPGPVTGKENKPCKRRAKLVN